MKASREWQASCDSAIARLQEGLKEGDRLIAMIENDPEGFHALARQEASR